MKIARRIFLSLLFAFGIHALAANATLISGTQVFNVDLTAGLPTAFVNFGVFLNVPMVPGQTLQFTPFPDLNAGGTPLSPTTFSGLLAGTTITFSTSDANFIDGLFSVRLTVNTGTLQMDLTAFTSATQFGRPIVTVTPTLATVPEPTTLALLGLGLSGLALTRRRKSH